MKHKVFIPVTDDLLYDHPELITAPLRPYQIDNPCFHWMATIESPEDAQNDPKINMRFDHLTPLHHLERPAPTLREVKGNAIPAASALHRPSNRASATAHQAI